MKVVHQPAKGATRVFPTVPVGAVLDVSPREADALVATGAFRRVQQEEPAAEPAEEAQKPVGKNRRGKAANAVGGES